MIYTLYITKLCEIAAQRYRALMVILQSHNTKHDSKMLPNLVSCAFSTIPIFPPFNSQNFLFTCIIYSDIMIGASLATRYGSNSTGITGS